MPSKRMSVPSRPWPSPAWLAQYQRAQLLLDSPSVMARLAAEVRALDPLAPPAARVVVGRARLARASRVGVFSGSFNPLTLAHVDLLRAARAQYSLDALVWLCATRTVEKERVERATWPDRLAQLVARVRAFPPEVVALTNRGLYVEEARVLRLWLPPAAQLFLLVGFDKIVQILDPRYYTDRDAALRELFGLARVLVAPRMAAGAPELAALFARPENQPYAASVGEIEIPPSDEEVSSTLARALARDPAIHQARLRELLPPEGAALAEGTTAYADESTEPGQRYELRAGWLEALARIKPPRLRRLPPLDTLVALSLRMDAEGQALRIWLEQAQHDPHGALPSLPDLPAAPHPRGALKASED